MLDEQDSNEGSYREDNDPVNPTELDLTSLSGLVFLIPKNLLPWLVLIVLETEGIPEQGALLARLARHLAREGQTSEIVSLLEQITELSTRIEALHQVLLDSTKVTSALARFTWNACNEALDAANDPGTYWVKERAISTRDLLLTKLAGSRSYRLGFKFLKQIEDPSERQHAVELMAAQLEPGKISGLIEAAQLEEYEFIPLLAPYLQTAELETLFDKITSDPDFSEYSELIYFLIPYLPKASLEMLLDRIGGARIVAEEPGYFRMLMTMVPHLEPSQRGEVLAALLASGIQFYLEDRYALLPYLDEADQLEFLRQLNRETSDIYRTEWLRKLRQYAPNLFARAWQTLLAEMLNEVAAEAPQDLIEYLTDEELNLGARLNYLLPASVALGQHAPEILPELLAILSAEISEADLRSWWAAIHLVPQQGLESYLLWLKGMARLAVRLPTDLRTMAVNEVLWKAIGMPDPMDLIEVIGELSPGLTHEMHPQAENAMYRAVNFANWIEHRERIQEMARNWSDSLVNHVTDTVRRAMKWEDAGTTAATLGILAPFQPEEGRIKIWEEALKILSEADGPAVADFFVEFSNQLPELLLDKSLAIGRKLAKTAQATYQAAPHDIALAALVPSLAASGREDEALAICWEILSSAQRRTAIINMIEYLSRAAQQQAWQVAADIDNPIERFLAQACLAAQLPEPARSAELKKILTTAGVIGLDLHELLAVIGPRLPKDLKPLVLNLAQRAGGYVLFRSAVELALWIEPPLNEILGLKALSIISLEGGWGGGGGYQETTQPEATLAVSLARLPLVEREATLRQALLDRLVQIKVRIPESKYYQLSGHEFSIISKPEYKPVPMRLVNTGFSPRAQPEDMQLPETPLRQGEAYYFWLEVGSQLVASIELESTPLPVEHLPKEAVLQVALFPFPGELELDPEASVGEIRLTPEGAAIVIRQPSGETLGIRPESLMRRLYFPLLTPARTGKYRLRCNIYHKGVLVQSRLVTARVMRNPRPIAGALQSRLDYTLSRSLASEHLTSLSTHKLSLMSNDNGDGTHSFRFFGDPNYTNNATFNGLELADLIDHARRALRRVTWGDEGEWDGKKSYLYGGPFVLERLKRDLISLAIQGYRFYDAMINRLAGGADRAESLSVRMRVPERVQIAMKQSASYIIPAAMIYDYGLDTNAPLEAYKLCPKFLDALGSDKALEDCVCFQGRCPNVGEETTVCPSGFWGYRHYLGLPPSLADSPDLPEEIQYQDLPEIAMAVSTDEKLTLRVIHEQSLRQLPPGAHWNYAANRAEALTLLKMGHPHLVYFYCHGGVSNKLPFLQVGSLNERGITRDNIRLKHIKWDSTRPLVFINGCHTTALTPEAAFEFVSAFVENASASGVIGTEITVFEALARTFAESFLKHFMSGVALGEAIRSARLELLKQGNPLGLVYIPFGLASLKLVGKGGG